MSFPDWSAAAQALQQDPSSLVDVDELAQFLDLDPAGLEASALSLTHLYPELWLRRERIHAVRQKLRQQNRITSSRLAEWGFRDRAALDATFQKSQCLLPKAYQRLLGAKSFELKLPDWLRFGSLKAYWGRDPKSVCERVEGDRLSWAIRSPDGPLWITIELKRPRARCEIGGPGSADPEASYFAHQTLLRLLGLHIDPRPFEERMTAGPWASLIADREGWTPPQTADLFDALVWVIAGQQVSLAAAFSIRRRLNVALGQELDGGWFVPPSPNRIADVTVETLAKHGLTRRKAESLSLLAGRVLEDENAWRLESWQTMPAPEIESRLLAQKGLGPWSVGYLMMRALGFADCVPLGDVVLHRKLQHYFQLEERPDREQTSELMQRFSPYRSLATFHFWGLPDP